VAWRSGHTGPLILAGGKSVTVNDMVAAARRVTGRPIPVENVPVGPGEMPAVVVDISAARALGYQPTMDLDTGLATVWPEFDPDRARMPEPEAATPASESTTATPAEDQL
jgi:UDP-glucose 4-epimerase